jgi:hypothetical protein
MPRNLHGVLAVGDVNTFDVLPMLYRSPHPAFPRYLRLVLKIKVLSFGTALLGNLHLHHDLHHRSTPKFSCLRLVLQPELAR